MVAPTVAHGRANSHWHKIQHTLTGAALDPSARYTRASGRPFRSGCGSLATTAITGAATSYRKGGRSGRRPDLRSVAYEMLSMNASPSAPRPGAHPHEEWTLGASSSFDTPAATSANATEPYTPIWDAIARESLGGGTVHDCRGEVGEELEEVRSRCDADPSWAPLHDYNSTIPCFAHAAGAAPALARARRQPHR